MLGSPLPEASDSRPPTPEDQNGESGRTIVVLRPRSAPSSRSIAQPHARSALHEPRLREHHVRAHAVLGLNPLGSVTLRRRAVQRVIGHSPSEGEIRWVSSHAVQ